MATRLLIAGFLFFSFGLWVGSQYLRPAVSASSNTAPSSSALEKLQRIADVDLEDYYRLKTMEDRYRKADDILGKIMVIFLADLGLRVSEKSQLAAHQALPSAAPNSISPELESTKISASQLSSKEGTLLDARDESSVEELVRRTRLEGFENALKLSSDFSNRANLLSSLNGHFEGSTKVSIKGQSELWTVQLQVAANMEKGNLAGTVRIRFLKEGKVFSDSRSNGSRIDSFREFASGSPALLVKASPNLYMQLYYLKELDQLAANLYQRANEAEGFEPIGSLALKRAP